MNLVPIANVVRVEKEIVGHRTFTLWLDMNKVCKYGYSVEYFMLLDTPVKLENPPFVFELYPPKGGDAVVYLSKQYNEVVLHTKKAKSIIFDSQQKDKPVGDKEIVTRWTLRQRERKFIKLGYSVDKTQFLLLDNKLHATWCPVDKYDFYAKAITVEYDCIINSAQSYPVEREEFRKKLVNTAERGVLLSYSVAELTKSIVDALSVEDYDKVTGRLGWAIDKSTGNVIDLDAVAVTQEVFEDLHCFLRFHGFVATPNVFKGKPLTAFMLKGEEHEEISDYIFIFSNTAYVIGTQFNECNVILGRETYILRNLFQRCSFYVENDSYYNISDVPFVHSNCINLAQVIEPAARQCKEVTLDYNNLAVTVNVTRDGVAIAGNQNRKLTYGNSRSDIAVELTLKPIAWEHNSDVKYSYIDTNLPLDTERINVNLERLGHYANKLTLYFDALSAMHVPTTLTDVSENLAIKIDGNLSLAPNNIYDDSELLWKVCLRNPVVLDLRGTLKKMSQDFDMVTSFINRRFEIGRFGCFLIIHMQLDVPVTHLRTDYPYLFNILDYSIHSKQTVSASFFTYEMPVVFDFGMIDTPIMQLLGESSVERLFTDDTPEIFIAVGTKLYDARTGEKAVCQDGILEQVLSKRPESMKKCL